MSEEPTKNDEESRKNDSDEDSQMADEEADGNRSMPNDEQQHEAPRRCMEAKLHAKLRELAQFRKKDERHKKMSLQHKEFKKWIMQNGIEGRWYRFHGNHYLCLKGKAVKAHKRLIQEGYGYPPFPANPRYILVKTFEGRRGTFTIEIVEDGANGAGPSSDNGAGPSSDNGAGP